MANQFRFPERKDILGSTRVELEDYFAALGEKPFRAKQILKWIYRRRLRDFEPMTDMPLPLRAKLAETAKIGRLRIADRASSPDGATKLLFELHDGMKIEAVHIPTDDRETACLSTQVGCGLGCRFCATAKMGFIRNLTPGEIVGQFIGLEETLGVSLSNVVFMGMGEPLLNLQSVLSAINILTDDCAFGLGHRRIIVSTIGIPDKIEELLESGLKPKLAISLNAPDDELRAEIMPEASKIASISEILETASRFATETARWFTVEYVLLGGVNDTLDYADRLAELVLPLPCKVNLIRYNPIRGLQFKSPLEEAVTKFQAYLLSAGVTATLRQSRGQSISAACGQLAVGA